MPNSQNCKAMNVPNKKEDAALLGLAISLNALILL
jgi:hypothetical protein